MSSAPRGTEAPSWAWYSEGSSPNFRRFMKKIIHWGSSDTAVRKGLTDLSPISQTGPDNLKGGGYRTWWRERDGTAVSAVLMAYPVTPTLAVPLRDSRADDPGALHMVKVNLNHVESPQPQQGARWVVVAAADAPAWQEEWSSPLHRMLTPVPDLEWDNALPAQYAPLKLSYGTRNELPTFLSYDLAESLLGRLQQMAYTTTVLHHEPSDASWAYGPDNPPSWTRSLIEDAAYEQCSLGLTLTLTVGDTSRETLLPALRRRGLQLPPGGALVLPHTPLRPRYPTRPWVSAGNERPGVPRISNVVYRAVRSPALLPADVASLLQGAREDCLTHSANLRDAPRIPAQSVVGADPGSESLRAERDDARAQLKALRERMSDMEAALQEATAANEKLEAELSNEAHRELREITAAALAQSDEVAQYAELLEVEVDDQLRRAAYWRGQAILQGRPGTEPPAEPDSSVPQSWTELGELLAETTERLVFPDWEVVSQGLAPQRSWISRTLRACQALEDYADCRVQAIRDNAVPNDLVHFAAYLMSETRNAVIPASMWSLGEGVSVVNDERLYERRVFPVPVETSPSRMAYMGSHLRIGQGSGCAPRMHVLDDTGNSGKIIIGYVGPHLPNRLTN